MVGSSFILVVVLLKLLAVFETVAAGAVGADGIPLNNTYSSVSICITDDKKKEEIVTNSSKCAL